MACCLVYITYPDEETANRVVDRLLEKRLIACANLFPITSAYWWKGSLERAREIVSICKTRSENWERVQAVVIELHPYEVPCIVKLEAEASGPFGAWIRDETQP